MLITKKNFFLLVMLISLLTIISAIYIEYILQVPACKLCIYQRVPYLIAIAVCFFGYYSNFKNICLHILGLTFFFSIILSSYHVGIENNIFSEFSGCVTQNMNITDKKELLEIIKAQRPSCKNVNFTILGFSLATINLIISIAITLGTIKYIYNEKIKSKKS